MAANMFTEHPFNLRRRWGALWFLLKKNSVCKFEGEFFSNSDMGRKNILNPLYAIKNVFVEKKNVSTCCLEKNSAAPRSEFFF